MMIRTSPQGGVLPGERQPVGKTPDREAPMRTPALPGRGRSRFAVVLKWMKNKAHRLSKMQAGYRRRHAQHFSSAPISLRDILSRSLRSVAAVTLARLPEILWFAIQISCFAIRPKLLSSPLCPSARSVQRDGKGDEDRRRFAWVAKPP